MGTSLLGALNHADSGVGRSSLRLQEAEHRHRNTLQILANLVRRSLREAEGGEARELLSSVSELIATMIELNNLCRDSDEDLATLLAGMARHWQRLCNGHIRLSVEAEDGLTMPQGNQTVAILITQELILNAVKHAFNGRKNGTIQVMLYCNDTERVTLRVQDDGTGVSANSPRQPDGSSHGQNLVDDLSCALGGTVQRGKASNGAGHCVTVRWPL